MGFRETIARFRTDPSWRYPLVVGALSVPLTVLVQQSVSDGSGLVPPLLAGIAAGILCHDATTTGRRVGWRAGLVAGTGVLVGVVTFLIQAPDISHTLVSVGFAGFAMTAVVGIFVLVFGLVGAVGGVLGEKLRPIARESRLA